MTGAQEVVRRFFKPKFLGPKHQATNLNPKPHGNFNTRRVQKLLKVAPVVVSVSALGVLGFLPKA